METVGVRYSDFYVVFGHLTFERFLKSHRTAMNGKLLFFVQYLKLQYFGVCWYGGV